MFFCVEMMELFVNIMDLPYQDIKINEFSLLWVPNKFIIFSWHKFYLELEFFFIKFKI